MYSEQTPDFDWLIDRMNEWMNEWMVHYQVH